jgi:predicted Zn-dependent protease
MMAPHSLFSTSPRRVLSRDDVVALGRRLLELVSARSVGVRIEHTARAVTKVTNGRTLTADDGDRVQITFQSQFGSCLPVSIGTNQLDDTTLRRVVAQADAAAPVRTAGNDTDPVDYSDQEKFTFNPRTFLPVSLWHETTARAMDSARSEIIPRVIEQLRGSGLDGAATVGVAERSVLYLYKEGLTAFADETDAELTVTARTPDYQTSGWGGAASRNWTQLSPDDVVAHAIDMANRGRNPVALEPGRRVAILGPAAVAEMVCEMTYAFDSQRTMVVGKVETPFTLLNHERSGRHTKLGRRVFDPRIMITSDPADVLGGYPPFFEAGGIENAVWGFPTPAMTWIDRGVLANLAYKVNDSLTRALPACDIPTSVRLAPIAETRTATIDEMIANCEEGIYVPRFSDVFVVDRPSGMMSGVTRDGCFLIKHGKIDRPVKNFWFLDSPFFAFNKMEMIGTPERVAFGYNTPPTGQAPGRWPRLPVIVPPMMIQDFNFSALADAV